MRICLLAQTLGYVKGGGHFWVYLNWALGFHRAGTEIVWLETVSAKTTPEEFSAQRAILEQRLGAANVPVRFGFISEDGAAPAEKFGPLPKFSELAEACDVLVSFRYGLPQHIVSAFRRSALIDIDPGLLQHWVQRGYFPLARHDFYFSISDNVGHPDSTIPDLGLLWHHTPPCVDTLSWPVTRAHEEAPFTTITHWEAEEYVTEEDGSFYENTKKAAFEAFLNLPRLVTAPLELALCLAPERTEEWQRLRSLGWRVRSSEAVSDTPALYQAYVQSSRGEFSVSKPAYRKMQSGWISDRTLCYLASGKPAVVENTGPLRFVPHGAGLLRFTTLREAVEHLQMLTRHYEEHAAAARHLADTIFDAPRVARRFLEIVMP